MAETLLQYQKPVIGSDGTAYDARACGRPMPGGTWEGWIEFVPVGGGEPVRSPRETTQPNRTDTEYWATGLTQVYLEGALSRALDVPAAALTAPRPPAVFSGPMPRLPATEAGTESVLDPFSVYQKGEALLRKQLSALSVWHLVNIISAYDLGNEDPGRLNRRSPAELIDAIVDGVRAERSVVARRM